MYVNAVRVKYHIACMNLPRCVCVCVMPSIEQLLKVYLDVDSDYMKLRRKSSFFGDERNPKI